MLKRTHTCGELRKTDTGKKVILNGWVKNWRDHGGLIFIDIRDRYGFTQLVFNPEKSQSLYKQSQSLRNEFVIAIEGIVNKRPEEACNKEMLTGDIEIEVTELQILNESKTPPFEIKDEIDVTEENRLKFRYLDLRRDKLQKNMLIRSELYQVVRQYLHNNNFAEIETPFLMRSTPEGARDYLVPSRNYHGRFYALPQSPQTYKQLLMVSGFDRYFQIVKCFRDEDLRKDRQPEFTQIDIEMSFIDEQDIMQIAEGIVKESFQQILNIKLSDSFPVMSFEEAMLKFGSDKPDLRYELQIKPFNDIFRNTSFNAFKTIIDKSGFVGGISINQAEYYSRKKIDKLTDYLKKFGSKGLVWLKFNSGKLEGPVVKFFSEEEINQLIEQNDLRENDVLFIVADQKLKALTILGELRKHLAEEFDLIDHSKFVASWVIDFPMLEFDEDENRYFARHHPFTSPKTDQMDKLLKEPEEVLSRAYDLVINGYEIAGGSIRIHSLELQKKVFQMLGISDEESESKFGFLLNALQYGAPPHGGIAFGLDRFAMILSGTNSIRDVIAFPKTTSALSLMDGAPADVSELQLKELGLSLLKNESK